MRHVGSESLDQRAVYVGVTGLDFEVLEAPERVHHVRALADRCRRAVGVRGTSSRQTDHDRMSPDESRSA